MILTVTPNAAVDRTYRIDGFALDRVNRPSEAFTVAGGKGINVARVYQTLGGRAIATGFLGGNNGRIVAEALEREGIANACVPVTGETRLCIAVIDPSTGSQTEINERGAVVSTEDVEMLIHRVDSLLTQNAFEFVVLSGSLPPGVPLTLYADLIGVAHRAGVRTVLDSSGAALRQGLYARPWMVKPNRAELAAIRNDDPNEDSSFATDWALGVGRSALERDDLKRGSLNPEKGGSNERSIDIDSAQALHSEYNIPVVALTLGSEGAILVAEGKVWCATPPPIEFASAVASGDSFLAAFLWSWNHSNSSSSNSSSSNRNSSNRNSSSNSSDVVSDEVFDKISDNIETDLAVSESYSGRADRYQKKLERPEPIPEWLRPEDPASALRLATGAGAANAAVIGAGFCTRESIFALAAKAELHVPHPEMR